MPSTAPRVAKRAQIARLLADRRGLSTVEYVIILVLVCAVSIAVWRTFGQSVKCALVRHAWITELADPSEGDQRCPGGENLVASGDAALRQVSPSRSSSGCSRNPGGGSSGPAPAPSPGPAPAPTPTPTPPAPLTAAEQTIQDVQKIFCPQDRAVLEALKKKGTKITVYNSIYYEDPVYDGKKWTTTHVDVDGTASPDGMEINLVRSNQGPVDQAATLYHEAWHVGQPPSMEQREKEYEAYRKTDEWRIARGLPPGPFTTKDKAGKLVVDTAAIKAHVDGGYAGITVPSPKGSSAPPESIVGRTASGDTIVRRANGSPARATAICPPPPSAIPRGDLSWT
jgi:Flp pilus assembly pilin Flp